MLRKLPSVALLALGLGLGAVEHPAQGASYAGGARIESAPCPRNVADTPCISNSVKRSFRTYKRPFLISKWCRSCAPSTRRCCSLGP